MWYKYIIPRKVYFLGKPVWRWCNHMFISYPKELVWENEMDGKSKNFVAFVMGQSIPYAVEPDGKNGYAFCGPGLPCGYRRTLDEAARACEQHYQRHFLKIDGILD